MLPECVEYYNKALKSGQKYVKTAVSRGSFPYPLVLDDLLEHQSIASYQDLGLRSIPISLIAGTKSSGRTYALAGNFMPLLSIESEFASKWLNLCNDQLGDEGIHHPIKCYEYMGRFYVEEGNKRVSVLKTMDAAIVSANITRVMPAYSEDESVQYYYSFVDFYDLAGIYGINFSDGDSYDKLQAALGFGPEHVWSDEERRSFQSGFTKFSKAFCKHIKKAGDITDADALLSFLDVFAFSEIKSMSVPELEKAILKILPDAETQQSEDQIELSTTPDTKNKSLLSKVNVINKPNHLNIAFIYAFDPDKSIWTREHDMGRQYLEDRMGERITVSVISAYDHDYLSAMEKAAEGGAEVIFATTPAMISDCRIFAARHDGIKVLNCSLSQPYQSVRTYYSRIYEIKYITGAIAGAMAENDKIGYVANYPIFSVPASINAFALGARLTNPRAEIVLEWSCTSGNPIDEFKRQGISLISNRDAGGPKNAHLALDWGVYKLADDGSLTSFATPHWYWGRMYRQLVESIFSKTWSDAPKSKALNYWWGLDSGVMDIKLGDALPVGVRSLSAILREGIISGSIEPFKSVIRDQNGTVRNDGQSTLSAEEILSMDYFCDNVSGAIPGLDEISPEAMEVVRRMGLYREYLPPEIKEKQL